MDLSSIHDALVQREALFLRPGATPSTSAIRLRPEPTSDVRTEFQRDRDRVTHAKAFRRLMHKTQVFISPDGDHFRTRLTHTLEVTQIARTIGRALRLNEDLVEAIGLAHDLGHTPFGHAGERALSEVFPGFRHNEQSLRVVDRIEKDGQGLNLTEQVRDGILRHSKPAGDITGSVSGRPATPEAQVVKISDGVAYVNHDLDDALRAGMIDEASIPQEVTEVLGRKHAERINALVCDIIEQSDPDLDRIEVGGQYVVMSDAIRHAADCLRDFLFEHVYTPINAAETTHRAQRMLQWLYEHYATNPDQVPPEFARALASDDIERVAIDYVASMTDRYAISRFQALYVPNFWSA